MSLTAREAVAQQNFRGLRVSAATELVQACATSSDAEVRRSLLHLTRSLAKGIAKERSA